MLKKGRLISISGPSGVGKGTLCKRLLERNPNIQMSVSATTRSARNGEINGVDYYFVSREEFEEMIESDALLEYMDVFGTNYYGTPKKYVNEKLNNGFDVILEIDVNGTMKVKKKMPELVTVFIMPPSMEILHSRLEGRGTETESQIEKRFLKAKEEIARAEEYDYIVVNDDIDRAVCEIENFLKSLK